MQNPEPITGTLESLSAQSFAEERRRCSFEIHLAGGVCIELKDKIVTWDKLTQGARVRIEYIGSDKVEIKTLDQPNEKLS